MQERLQYLFGQYLENKCSRKELEEFFSYIRKAEHDESLRQLIRAAYHSSHKEIGTLTSVDEKGQLVFNEPDWLNKLPVSTRRRAGRKVLIAACGLVLLGAVVFVSLRSPVKGPVKTAVASLTRKTTDRSESKFILLEDSTKVWLNAASSLEFPDQFSGKTREVYLSGEAYFDVKHADKLPFIIHTGELSTTVLGTAFNIKAYPGQKNIVVSVSRGKVRVSRQDQLLTTLVKGQQAKIEDRGPVIMERAVSETGIAAWQQGTLNYEEESLGEILTDLERVYNVSIVLQRTGIKQTNISTSFQKEIGIEQALQVLCKLTDTELKTGNGVYTIK